MFKSFCFITGFVLRIYLLQSRDKRLITNFSSTWGYAVWLQKKKVIWSEVFHWTRFIEESTRLHFVSIANCQFNYCDSSMSLVSYSDLIRWFQTSWRQNVETVLVQCNLELWLFPNLKPFTISPQHNQLFVDYLKSTREVTLMLFPAIL